MATRIQSKILGLSTDAQADIATASSTFVRFKQLNASLTSPNYVTENDAAEVGKGNEFINQVFKSHINVQNSLEKYASAEWMAWVCRNAFGHVVTTGTSPHYTYTITPIDPGTTLELPYFSAVEQVAEGGGEAIDNLFTGCAIEDFTYSFSSGPGRASSKCTANWVGAGTFTTPSGISVPSTLTESNMLAASMTLTVNGVDYVGTKRIVSGNISWKNNLLLNAGFFPGSGEQDGFQTRGRIEIGARALGFNFVVRAISGSTEYTTLKNLTSGTATLTVQYDSTDSIQFVFQKVYFAAVELGEADGLVTFNVTTDPAFDATNGLITVTAKSSIALT